MVIPSITVIRVPFITSTLFIILIWDPILILMIALYVSTLITTVQPDDGVLAETCCIYINYK